MRLLTLFTSLLTVASAAVTKRAVTPGTLSQVTNFDAPTKAGFFIYVPKKLASSPGIIVAIHYCTGTGQAYYQQTSYKTLAEQYGFIVIYPSSPNEGKCWDVSSTKSLTHNGGGDSNTIANMVKWTLKEYNANAKKVFVTGSSSGAMMTNVMAAAYPDMFAAASLYSGVPAGCFKSPSGAVDAWNSDCAHGRVTNTPAGWAKIVQAMDPGYSGARPKMLVYHGSADTTLYPPNYQETMKEWAGVFGYNYDKPQSVQQNTPLSGYTKTTWGPNVVGVYAAGVGHTVPVRENDDMKWFGFA